MVLALGMLFGFMAFLWLVFFKFKWLKFSVAWAIVSAFIVVHVLLIFLIGLRFMTPASNNAKVVQHTIQLVPRLSEPTLVTAVLVMLAGLTMPLFGHALARHQIVERQQLRFARVRAVGEDPLHEIVADVRLKGVGRLVVQHPVAQRLAGQPRQRCPRVDDHVVGMVPAVLMGVDVGRLLSRAQEMAGRSSPSTSTTHMRQAPKPGSLGS